MATVRFLKAEVVLSQPYDWNVSSNLACK